MCGFIATWKVIASHNLFHVSENDSRNLGRRILEVVFKLIVVSAVSSSTQIVVCVKERLGSCVEQAATSTI